MMATEYRGYEIRQDGESETYIIYRRSANRVLLASRSTVDDAKMWVDQYIEQNIVARPRRSESSR